MPSTNQFVDYNWCILFAVASVHYPQPSLSCKPMGLSLAPPPKLHLTAHVQRNAKALAADNTHALQRCLFIVITKRCIRERRHFLPVPLYSFAVSPQKKFWTTWRSLKMASIKAATYVFPISLTYTYLSCN